MSNLIVRGRKAWWSVLGMCLVLLGAPLGANAAPTYSTVFAFDLHQTTAGVVEGSGSNVGMLFGTTSDTSLSYGGSIYKVAMNGGEPRIIYQLKDTDGYSPQAKLLASTDPDGYLYGSTTFGARVSANTQSGSGTIFKVAQDGSGFTTLHVFTGATSANTVTGKLQNEDGMYPSQALIEDSYYLYGVTQLGGHNGSGTVFRIRKLDNFFETLHHFAATDAAGANSEGAYPSSPLTLDSDERLYGVTSGGGSNLKTTTAGTVGVGTIYSLNPSAGPPGYGFETYDVFEALDDTAAGTTNAIGVNVTGAQPMGTLLELPDSPGVFIGTASDGGNPALNATLPTTATTGFGTVFRFDTTTTPTPTLTTLYNFDNDHGATPKGDLVLGDLDGLVYGLTLTGSSVATTETPPTPATLLGGVFSINPSSGAFTVVKGLAASEGSGFTGGLIRASDGDLYGTVQYGNACTAVSSSGYGAVFRYSIATEESSTTYISCTVYDTGGGGSMAPGLLWLLAALGFVPPVRRRLFGFN